MSNWAILAAVKILKTTILAGMSLMSFAVDQIPQMSDVSDSTHVRTVIVGRDAHTMIGPSQLPTVPDSATLTGPVLVRRIENAPHPRLSRLAPPARIELIFSPDVLTPHVRDPSL